MNGRGGISFEGKEIGVKRAIAVILFVTLVSSFSSVAAVIWPEQTPGLPYETHVYEPFGADFDDIGVPILGDRDIRYTGKPFDASTGKHYFNARYLNTITDTASPGLPPRFLTPDIIEGTLGNPQSWNRYAFCLNNPVNFVDPNGLFDIYVHTQGFGHVGVRTNYNGNLVSYDFGRYHGKYKDSIYSGPNILMRTPGESRALKKTGGKAYNFEVSQELDNIIALEFQGNYDKGSSSIPNEIQENMLDKSSLQSNERYMGSDWGLTGPNCVTFSFDTLIDALNKVIKGQYSDDLKTEAKSTKRNVKKARSFTPDRVKNNLEDLKK